MEHELSTTIDSIPKGMVHGACGPPSFGAPAPGCASVTYRTISPAYYYHGPTYVNISCLALLFCGSCILNFSTFYYKCMMGSRVGFKSLHNPIPE
ncbi:hypothetical protein TWF173_006206 [Orbilia oligospora]|nr:hypothetical protein TWF173_006206 [Orbilia oligospora]